MDPRPLFKATPRDLHGRPTTMRTGQSPIGAWATRRASRRRDQPERRDEDPTAGAPTGTIAPTETCRGGRAPARGIAALARKRRPRTAEATKARRQPGKVS